MPGIGERENGVGVARDPAPAPQHGIFELGCERNIARICGQLAGLRQTRQRTARPLARLRAITAQAAPFAEARQAYRPRGSIGWRGNKRRARSADRATARRGTRASPHRSLPVRLRLNPAHEERLGRERRTSRAASSISAKVAGSIGLPLARSSADLGQAQRNLDGGMASPELRRRSGVQRCESAQPRRCARPATARSSAMASDDQAPDDQAAFPPRRSDADSSAAADSAGSSSDFGIIRISVRLHLAVP